ncbi:hypothetical protein ABW16_21540 [Mycolicibacter heraklionensis]|uniref:Uncharacterized protein n=1 Tax=Mycolicibacter heraklionensis TaxID=512402 RepID=A0ABR5FA27_9MYCO|nr:hypothetical protein [Mycolicibacter heraklionensis]KLO25897.1 hypothetical protein ABW16_21540 [Mycolicibacter heraklionensis]
MSVLALTVYVTDNNGDVHQCLAGTSPRAELAELIRNPAAWENPDAAGPADSADDRDPVPAHGGPPPHGGPRGSRKAWESYALAMGVELEDGLKRDGIIDACERAGIAV